MMVKTLIYSTPWRSVWRHGTQPSRRVALLSTLEPLVQMPREPSLWCSRHGTQVPPLWCDAHTGFMSGQCRQVFWLIPQWCSRLPSPRASLSRPPHVGQWLKIVKPPVTLA